MSPPVALDTRVPALLLRLDRNPFHHGSLGAVRSLGRAGVEAHAFVESPTVPLARSRYLAAAHRFRGDPRSAEDVADALLAAAARIGRPAVLIPMDDAGALAIAGLADRLDGHFLFPRLPAGLAERAADKARLAELCAASDIPHPPTIVPGTGAEAAAAARELGLPVVAKWSRPWLLPPGAGLRSVTVVTSAAEAARLHQLSGSAGSELLLQRLLPAGGAGTDWFFHGCFAAGGRPLLTGTGHKELSWPPRAGLTAVGSWLPNPAVAEPSCRLAAAVGYHGVLDLDFRRDPHTGAHHLLDFNPRPGAQFRLFTDRATGLDVIRALHLDLTGRSPTALSRPRAGRMFVVEQYGLLASLATRRAHWPGSGGRETEWAWSAPDDPAPLLALPRQWLRRDVLRRGMTRLAGASRHGSRAAAGAAGVSADTGPASGGVRTGSPAGADAVPVGAESRVCGFFGAADSAVRAGAAGPTRPAGKAGPAGPADGAAGAGAAPASGGAGTGPPASDGVVPADRESVGGGADPSLRAVAGGPARPVGPAGPRGRATSAAEAGGCAGSTLPVEVCADDVGRGGGGAAPATSTACGTGVLDGSAGAGSAGSAGSAGLGGRRPLATKPAGAAGIAPAGGASHGPMGRDGDQTTCTELPVEKENARCTTW
ncbi:carboxylate--amine ligase [Streptomyces mayteni]